MDQKRLNLDLKGATFWPYVNLEIVDGGIVWNEADYAILEKSWLERGSIISSCREKMESIKNPKKAKIRRSLKSMFAK